MRPRRRGTGTNATGSTPGLPAAPRSAGAGAPILARPECDAGTVILEFPSGSPADEAERCVPDVAAARALAGACAAPLHALLAARRHAWKALVATPEDAALLARTEAAVWIAYVRMALRHGHLGRDLHAYHNETHILDICGARIDRLDLAGDGSLRDGCALMLFGAGHDLRQREAPRGGDEIGANECASIEETWRILDVCGFSREHDADLYAACELGIAGSTFDARPPGGLFYNAADLVQNGGALAARLDRLLDAQRPGWRNDAVVQHAQRLALIAADLDTANVAESFTAFATTTEHLCREREMLSGRSLHAAESALPVLGFLTEGQRRFFFELHRFQSEPGHAAFAAAKDANAAKLSALCISVRARLAMRGPPADGDAVIAVYRETLAGLAD